MKTDEYAWMTPKLTLDLTMSVRESYTCIVDLNFILSHLVDSRNVSYTDVQVIKDNLANKVEAKSEADSPSGETDRKASKKTSQYFALFYLIV